ncbi:hypothetical protein [Parvularcula dongshanensis]|uniref:Uncharacterized protein n=1 Tax=Parvularcula dongshanensis TaxID=1173995 RepID=A0A840I8A6_9PROT|nr:hypothetical protein [Parvularcula dongshanensis]MBB4660338.1 hypothetical protein [Parvularcula dongshanensis]
MRASIIAASLAALTIATTAAADHHKEMANAPSASELTGAWTDGDGTLNLMPGGHFAAVYGDRFVIGMGTYEVSDGEITVTDRDGFNPCGDPATYAYELGDNEVTFTVVGEDTCEGRKEVVDGKTWTKAQMPDMDS